MAEKGMVVNIFWKRYCSYEKAKEVGSCVYIFEWDGSPHYIGMVGASKFGTRYASGYRHLVDGSLEHGARLFIGELTTFGDNREILIEALSEYNDVLIGYTEKKLIDHLDPKANKPYRYTGRKGDLTYTQEKELDKFTGINHIGDKPEYLKQ